MTENTEVQLADGTILDIQGKDDFPLFNKSGVQLATGYTRIVIGGRGNYIEFTDEQLVWENLSIPDDKRWRLDSEHAYFIEWRSTDESYVKVYHQKRLVDYADYRLGWNYISPDELVVAESPKA